jgi:tetraspanin-18
MDPRILKRNSKINQLINCICSISLARLLLVLLNAVYIVVGSVIFVAGLWAGFDRRSFVEVTGVIKDEVLISRLNDIADATILGKTSIVVVVFGTIILILSLLGYIAAAGERRYLLNCYATILIAMVMMETATACAAVVYKNAAETTIKNALRAFLKKYSHMNYRGKRDGLTLMWDRIMADYECCGIYNFTDFRDDSDWMVPGLKVVPESCCILKDKVNITANDTACTMKPTVLNSHKDKGCYEAVTVTLVKHTDIPILIAAVLLLSQVTGIILASRLSQTLIISTAEDMWGYNTREIGELSGTFIDLRYVMFSILSLYLTK